jgi:hypothetical protein
MKHLGLIAIVLLVSAASWVLAPSHAEAERKVYLNGVDLSGVKVTDQVFESCVVRFDDNGDLHITAPGVKIEKRPVEDKAALPEPAAPLEPVARGISSRLLLPGSLTVL